MVNLDGQASGTSSHDAKVLNNEGKVVGEVIPESVMIDIWGNYSGFLNALGDVSNLRGDVVTAILPGGSTDGSLNILRRGSVIDFSGNVIGVVAPDGGVVNSANVVIGKVLSDGNVLSISGKLIGEVVAGDIVIGNNDKVVGYVNFDGKIKSSDGKIIGKVLSGGLAVDDHNGLLGKIYKIGATVLGNDGSYKGRLGYDGAVIDAEGQNIGQVKSNGSFIDLDKKVSGYVLQEVAKNRRN